MNNEYDPFGKFPVLALPMFALILIIIGAALYTSKDDAKEVDVPPSTPSITREFENCVVLARTDLYVVYRCDQSRYNLY